MELYELKYFLGVAKFENIHRASEKLNVSTASLSKAISRLESDLGVTLFTRERRSIKLTAQGVVLQKKAYEMVQLEESLRFQVVGFTGHLQVSIAAPEILISKFGVHYIETIKKSEPKASFELNTCSEAEALQRVERGEAHLALVTGDVPSALGLTTKVIKETNFQTFAGIKHPLYLSAKSKKVISIQDVLQYSFVSPESSILGKVQAKQSVDGWRDDQFERKIEYRTTSLKTLEAILLSGKALAYLPDYYCESIAVEKLKISGCPYACTQKIKLVAKKPKDLGWLNQVF